MPGHDAEGLGGQAGDAREGDQRRAQAAEGDGGGVGDQAQHRRQERVEPQADQDGAADGHRRAAARCPFQKSPKGEADQNRLHPRIAG